MVFTLEVEAIFYALRSVMIDNYEEAMALIEQMKEQLPIPVYAGHGLMRMMRDKGMPIKARRRIMVIDVLYIGDEGGIMCALENIGDGKEAFLTSLTHLKVVARHPLAKAMRAYQRERTKKLALQDSGRDPSSMTFYPQDQSKKYK